MTALVKLGKRLQQRLHAVAAARRAWLRAALGAATVAALSAIVIGYGLQPTRIHLKVGQRSPRTIGAPHTVTYIDHEATERLRQHAEQWVVPVVVVRPEAIARAESEVAQAFAALGASGTTPADLERLFPGASPEALAWGQSQSAEHIAKVADAAVELAREAMSRPIADRVEAIEAARRSISDAARRLDLAPAARELAAAAARRVVRPNWRYDQGATEALRAAARRAVQPVENTIIAGKVILSKGEVVTAQDLEALRALGLLRPLPEVWEAGSVVALCLLATLAVIAYLRHQQREVYDDTRTLLLTALIAVAALSTVNLVNLRGPRGELLSMLTVTAATMMIAVLVGSRVALLVAAVESILVGVMAQGQLSLAALTFGSSLAGMLLARHIWPPSQLVGASIILAAINAALVVLVNQVAGGEHTLSQAWHAALYGAGAPMLAVGGILLLQRPFDIITHLRLVELANPNQPLLRRMLVEAPGTYSDSFLVANLAEAAAEAVGADGLLARVGSYYHDVGKLRRPYLFTENQSLLGIGNVHEQLTPSLSSLVITAHVKDGVELAREYRLPRVICDIIAQHHGTALVSFFYHQARAVPGGEGLQEESFRYPGPKPQTREAAIIMLADAAFAAVWSLAEKTPARVEAVVRQIVRERLEDGQLDESPLTLRDLSAITEAFLRLLKGIIFHTRVEYPQLAELEARRSGADLDHHAPRARHE